MKISIITLVLGHDSCPFRNQYKTLFHEISILIKMQKHLQKRKSMLPFICEVIIMYQEQRLEKILSLLEEKGELSTNEMVDYFNVSRDTIRRNFSILSNEGKVKRTHGGIMKISPENQIFSFNDRLKQLTQHKNHIAEKANDFIQNDEIYFFDVSTITLKLAQMVTKSATIYSHSLDNAIMLSNNSNVTFNLLGGKFFDKNRFYYSLREADILNNICFDIAFIGAAGLKKGVVSFEDQEDAVLKQLVLKNAKIKILLAEENKFSKSSTYTIGRIDEFDYFITDKRLNPEYLKYTGSVEIIY